MFFIHSNAIAFLSNTYTHVLEGRVLTRAKGTGMVLHSRLFLLRPGVLGQVALVTLRVKEQVIKVEFLAHLWWPQLELLGHTKQQG